MRLSAIVLTLNEEGRIATCLDCLKFADRRIVVDSGSTDHTQEIVNQKECCFFENSFKNFSDQRNFALEKASEDWVLFVDADEWVSDALAQEIKYVISLPNQSAYRIPRQNYFWGKQLRFCGASNDAPLRLFPRQSGVWRQAVHEFYDTKLPVQKLKHHLIHHTTRNRHEYDLKLLRYIPLEVETMQAKGRKPRMGDVWLRPLAKFFYLYLFQFGFLDGWVGLQYCYLSSYYDFKKYTLLKKMSRP